MREDVYMNLPLRTLEPFLFFALSHPVTTVVIGCDSLQQLEENVSLAQRFRPIQEIEMNDLIDDVKPYARELMYYKP